MTLADQLREYDSKTSFIDPEIEVPGELLSRITGFVQDIYEQRVYAIISDGENSMPRRFELSDFKRYNLANVGQNFEILFYMVEKDTKDIKQGINIQMKPLGDYENRTRKELSPDLDMSIFKGRKPNRGKKLED